jgi:hypothetical protein
MLSALSAEGAEYLLVGAYALAVHGRPRAAEAFDVWTRPTPENAGRVLRALGKFGAPLRDLRRDDLASAGVAFQIGLPPRRIDVLTAIDGVEFEEAWLSRTTVKVGPLTVPVLGRDALACNRRARGRPEDLADARWLQGEA